MDTPAEELPTSPAPIFEEEKPLSVPTTQDFLDDEADAIDRAAYCQLTMLEAAAAFLHVAEKLGFTPDTMFTVDKNLRRCLNAIGSAVPNQYKFKILQVMAEASRAVQDVEEAKALGVPVTDAEAATSGEPTEPAPAE